MSWTPRGRVWTVVSVAETPAGHAVLLDGRPLRTPAKLELTVASAALARAIAAEWDAVTDRIAPELMPFTRAANTALDRVARERELVIDAIAAYGESDLLCYRAEEPEDLRRQQDAAWDPWLAWAAAELDAPLTVVGGIIHQPQPPASLAALRREVARHDALELTALHELVTLSGSLVLGLAVARGAIDAAAAWGLSRLDELWQAELWGADDEAEEAAAVKSLAFAQAETLLRLLRRGESAH
ncbi:MAG: ATP12 family protein [Amaricoccus sp.]|uniref:ATP12 family chaperone protein n=1 Tax=Amaricoccus sp. TaxID=1872485 RepID=UPI00331601B3